MSCVVRSVRSLRTMLLQRNRRATMDATYQDLLLLRSHPVAQVLDISDVGLVVPPVRATPVNQHREQLVEGGGRVRTLHERTHVQQLREAELPRLLVPFVLSEVVLEPHQSWSEKRRVIQL